MVGVVMAQWIVASTLPAFAVGYLPMPNGWKTLLPVRSLARVSGPC